MKNKILLTLLLPALLISACSSSGELTILDPWARPAGAGENGAVYFIISNATNTNDTLLNVRTDLTSDAEIHMSMKDSNDVVSMQMQNSLPVPAQQEIIFKPGGLHVMLIGLNRDLRIGDTISLTLNFENAGSITIQAPIEEQ